MKSKRTDIIKSNLRRFGEETTVRNSTQQTRNCFPNQFKLQQRSVNFTGAHGLLGQNLATLRHQKLKTPVSY